MGSVRDPFQALEAELRALENAHLRRVPTVHSANASLNFASNDYLGFGSESLSIASRGGASASPIVSGHLAHHDAAERSIADWVGTETATLFSSTYAANLGLLQALGSPRTLIVSDALNHASIIDGCRLSRADVRVIPHLDLDAVRAVLDRDAHRYDAAWVVTEAYFSMDADSPDLRGLRVLCDTFGAGLIVDEAHSLGLFGDEGRGLCAAATVQPDIFVGALGKAVGLHGGFVAGPRVLQELLWNRARSLIFSTGISPLIAAAVPSRITSVRSAVERRERVHANAARLRSQLGSAARGTGPIVPWLVGESEVALEVARRVVETGLFVRAIRPPTVPRGSARLRLALSACHERVVIDRLASALTSSTVSRET
jgi:8-amino-7-oxononanoate synthase